MGSSYFGDPSLGSGRSGSSRKGKKKNSDKPKQPQRGLGVAQLEKIRLGTELGSCYDLPSLQNPSYTTSNNQALTAAFSSSSASYPSASSFGVHPSMMMKVGHMEPNNSNYITEPQSSGTDRIGRNYEKDILQPHHEVQSGVVTRQFLTPPMENSSQNNRRDMIWCESMGSGSSSNSSENQEIDLDLKL